LDYFHSSLTDVSSIVVVIMMAMVAVISSTPVIPGVSGTSVIIRLGIRVVRAPVIPVGIIIIARWISIIAARKSKADSHSGNPDGHLSVSTLPGNEGQSAYRQPN